MLQQTQVATVIPYFKRFIKEYPSLRSLIKASEDDILALWSGLGFYRRAKNIFLAKEKIKQDFKGRFPKNFDDILSLPGIGQSTAGAISSIALNNPHPILDANVKRVLKRFYGKDFNEKELWDLSKMATPQKNVFGRYCIHFLHISMLTMQTGGSLKRSTNVLQMQPVLKLLKVPPFGFTITIFGWHLDTFVNNDQI